VAVIEHPHPPVWLIPAEKISPIRSLLSNISLGFLSFFGQFGLLVFLTRIVLAVSEVVLRGFLDLFCKNCGPHALTLRCGLIVFTLLPAHPSVYVRFGGLCVKDLGVSLRKCSYVRFEVFLFVETASGRHFPVTPFRVLP